MTDLFYFILFFRGKKTVKNKGEFDGLPLIEDLKISVDEVLCEPLGKVNLKFFGFLYLWMFKIKGNYISRILELKKENLKLKKQKI